MIFLTTNELIEHLKKEDPRGQARVVIGNDFVTDVRMRDGSTVELMSRSAEAQRQMLKFG
jgi:siroheme synthase (precorrin-2 oxidase/ferrochelatase)